MRMKLMAAVIGITLGMSGIPNAMAAGDVDREIDRLNTRISNIHHGIAKAAGAGKIERAKKLNQRGIALITKLGNLRYKRSLQK